MERINLILGIANTACSLLVATISIPLIKKKIKRNDLYGFRFRKAFESDELWYKINKKGGQLLLLWSLPILAIGIGCFFAPKIERPITWVISYAPLLYVIAGLQCYSYAKKL